MKIVSPLVNFRVWQHQETSEAVHVMSRPFLRDPLVLSFENALMLPTHLEASLLYSRALHLLIDQSLSE